MGNGRKNDPIGRMIRDAIIQNNFIDVISACRGPTWDNGRSNDSFLAKRLDRFLLHGKLIERFGFPSVKIIPSFISDHRPISIQWKYIECKFGYPFKFNRMWLTDECFNEFIMESWQHPSCLAQEQTQAFIERISILRSKVKRWRWEKSESNRRDLKDIDKKLEYLSTKFK